MGLDVTSFYVTCFFVMTNPVEFCRALADTTRWRVVRLVLEDALCVCELADLLGMPQSSMSSHVQVIRRAGLLESEKCGKWTYFRIAKAWRPLVRSLVKAFPEDPVAEEDAANKARRLAVRESSCCQGPQKLATRRKSS
jgi:ArsR family transcriptional regulator